MGARTAGQLLRLLNSNRSFQCEGKYAVTEIVEDAVEYKEEK